MRWCTNPTQLRHQEGRGSGAPPPEGARYKCDQGHTSTHRQEQADKRVQGECTMSLDAGGIHNIFQKKKKTICSKCSESVFSGDFMCF